MPAFGLGYGLGQIGAGLPQAYMQGQQLGLQRQSQELELQKQRQALNEYNTTNKILSTPQQQSGLGYNQEQEEDPYEQQAKTHEAFANRFAEAGLGQKAEAERQAAAKARQLQIGYTGMRAMQLVKGGQYDAAIAMMNRRGMNIQAIAEDPDGEGNYIITSKDQSGKPTIKHVPKDDFEQILLSPEQAFEVMKKQAAPRIAAESRVAVAEKQVEGRKDVATTQSETRKDVVNIQTEAQKEIARNRLEAIRKGLGGREHTPADLKKIAFYEKSLIDNDGFSPAEARKKAIDLILGGRGKAAVSVSEARLLINSSNAIMKSILDDIGEKRFNALPSDHPTKVRYNRAKERAEEGYAIIEGVGAGPGTTRSVAPPPGFKIVGQ